MDCVVVGLGFAFEVGVYALACGGGSVWVGGV